MRRAQLVGGVIAVTFVVACGEVFSGPTVGQRTSLALALAWPGEPGSHAVFAPGIDSVHVRVDRQSELNAVDVTVAFPGDELSLRLDVDLLQEVETLYVYVELREGQSTLFYASNQVILREGVVPPTPELPLYYIGPGYNATTVTISPRISFLFGTQNSQLTATAYDVQGAPVPAPIGWSVSDTRLATVSSDGLITGKGANGTVRVRALTPTGIGDSLTITVSNLPQVSAPPR